jgi:hypothetical protein
MSHTMSYQTTKTRGKALMALSELIKLRVGNTQYAYLTVYVRILQRSACSPPPPTKGCHVDHALEIQV